MLHQQGGRGYRYAQEERKKHLKTDIYKDSYLVGHRLADDLINADYEARKKYESQRIYQIPYNRLF